MSPNNNFNILAWYDSVDQQNHRKSYVYDKIWGLIAPNNDILPFQFVSPGSNGDVTKVIVRDPDGKQVYDITGQLNIEVLSYTDRDTDEPYDIVMYKGGDSLVYTLPEGRYYLELKQGSKTWYSEVFTAVSCANCYIKLEYWDNDNLYFKGGHIEYSTGFKFVCYICTQIGKPSYPFEEELTERDGYKFIEKQTSSKQYNMVFDAPEFICDALRLVRMCDNIQITDKGKVYRVLSFAVSVDWEDVGDIASVAAEFETDTVVTKIANVLNGPSESGSSFKDALLYEKNSPIMFGEGTVAQYQKTVQIVAEAQLTGKLIRELDLYRGDLPENAYIAIDIGIGPALKFPIGSAISSNRFLRKDIDDVAAGNIRFSKAISSYAFAEGFLGTGWRITQEGDIEARSLLLREWLEVPELRYNRISVTGDEFWVATGLKVDFVTGNTIGAKLEEGEVIAVHAGDILRGIYHHDNGFSTSFIKVLTVDTSAGTFTFEKIRGADPVRFMVFARQGNDTDEERQRSIFLSGLDGYMRFMGGVNSADITIDNIYAQFGNINGLVVPFFGNLSGEGIYIRKAYIEGSVHVTGGNAATKDFVSTEIGKEIADLAIGVDNMLLNTGFAGDYLPAELDKMTLFNRQKILYSDPLKYWDVNGVANVITDSNSRSGYSVTLTGSLSQEPPIPIEVGEKYTISFKAKGSGTITASIGGVSGSITINSNYQRYSITLIASATSGFSLETSDASVSICEIKLERGSIATDWEPAFLDNNRMEGRLQAMQYIFDAVKNETNIYGGLILTNILMTGNYVNGRMSEVTAGLSGVYNDGLDVAFWAGGTLEEAIAAVANPNLTSGVANAVITHGGLAILNNAYIRGTIYATDGEFKGSIYANEGILTNVLIKTGDTGKRIELSSSNQSISFFNSGDKKVGVWEFDSWGSAISIAGGGQNEGRTALFHSGFIQFKNGNDAVSMLGPTSFSVLNNTNYGEASMYVTATTYGTSPELVLQINGLPTSKGNRIKGTIYVDGDTLKIIS